MRDMLSSGHRTSGYPAVSHSVIHSAPMLDPRLQLLADRIRTLIKASPYSQTAVADHLGVDRSAVSRWMSGERTPTLQNLIDLAALLRVELTDLWTGPETMPATPEQRAMLDRMGQMTPEQQQALLALAASFLNAPPR